MLVLLLSSLLLVVPIASVTSVSFNSMFSVSNTIPSTAVLTASVFCCTVMTSALVSASRVGFIVV